MRRTSLFSGYLYILLGCFFTFYAVQDVGQNGWGFFTYLLIFLATFNFGNGLKFIFFYFTHKEKIKK